MVEVTNPILIEKIRKILGLRGKVISTSRNSVYPAISYDVTDALRLSQIDTIALNASAGIGAYTLFTVPAKKRWYLMVMSKASTSVGTYQFYIDNGLDTFISGNNGNKGLNLATTSTAPYSLIVPLVLVLESGTRFGVYGGNVSDASINFAILYQEEDSY